MIEVDKRLRAADLVEKFRDGIISNFTFEESWPRAGGRDRALKAIRTMLWRLYSDNEEHTLGEEPHLLAPEVRDILDRCALFLRTDLDYEWPKDNFIGIGGLGPVGRILTFGLSFFIDRGLRRREEERLKQLRVLGPNATWPFLTESDLRECGK